MPLGITTQFQVYTRTRYTSTVSSTTRGFQLLLLVYQHLKWQLTGINWHNMVLIALEEKIALDLQLQY
jgi:hypothetical protein